MDQCTHEVRVEYWKGIIHACGQRPAGQSAKSRMEGNGICGQSYYHWQRKFRRQTYELMKDAKTAVPAATENTDVDFVEIPCIPPPQKKEEVMKNASAAVIRTGLVEIKIAVDIPDCVLTGILREVSHLTLTLKETGQA